MSPGLPRLEGFHKPDRKHISLTSVLLPRCWNEVLDQGSGGLLKVEISGDLDPEMYISADTRRSRSTKSGEGFGFPTGLLLYYVV